MINAATLSQVKAYARQEGIVLALLWMASMWMVIQSPESSWGSLLMLCTPFYVGWRLMVFRNKVLGGLISYRRGLCFSCYVFLYASILFALGQYLYFKFLDNGKFLTMVHKTLETVRPIYEQNGLGVENMDMAEKVLSMMNPMQVVLTFMMQNLVVGLVLSLVIALVCRKSQL